MSGIPYIPTNPKIYHIVHVDRVQNIVREGSLLCDAEMIRRIPGGTSIGMSAIKERRLKIFLASYPELRVGGCVPFYFCPRSVMLYLIHQGNHPDLGYKGGQDHIVHLEADLCKTVNWANQNGRRWVFTLSNAGSYYFEERCDLSRLGDLDWNAIRAQKWSECKEGKQAEFLLEHDFPFQLVERIGIPSPSLYPLIFTALSAGPHKPEIKVIKEWYY
jgi:hypothetical protein